LTVKLHSRALLRGEILNQFWATKRLKRQEPPPVCPFKENKS